MPVKLTTHQPLPLNFSSHIQLGLPSSPVFCSVSELLLCLAISRSPAWSLCTGHTPPTLYSTFTWEDRAPGCRSHGARDEAMPGTGYQAGSLRRYPLHEPGHSTGFSVRALPHSSYYRLPAYNATWEKRKLAEPKGPHTFPSFLQWEEIDWKGHGELLLHQEDQDSGQSIQTNPLHRRGSSGQRQEGKSWGTIRNLQRWLSIMEILALASPWNLPSAMPTFLATTVGSVAPNTAHHTVLFIVYHPQCQFQEDQDIFLLCHCCALWLQIAPGHSRRSVKSVQ